MCNSPPLIYLIICLRSHLFKFQLVMSWKSFLNESHHRQEDAMANAFGINSDSQYQRQLDEKPGIFQSLINKYTGAGLTREQVMNNDYQEYLSNTAYQRQVADMQAAGINPALAMGHSSGASTPTASTGSNGGNFADLVSMMMLPAQLKQINANAESAKSQAEVNRANARNIEEQTRNNKLNADFLEDTFDIRRQQLNESKKLTTAQTRAVYKNMYKMDKEIDLLVKQAATEDEKKALTYWQGQLAKANAEQIQALLPYEIEFKKAATKAQQAAAAASFTHAAYEQGLIDSGYIDALADEVKARAHSAEEQAIALEYINALKTGNITEFLNKVTGGSVPVSDGIVAAIMLVSSMIGNVFGSIFK